MSMSAATSVPTSRKILVALTSHAQKGNTGQPTGVYLSELTHADAVFRKAGFSVDYVSVRGGHVPLDGVDRADPANAEFLDNHDKVAALHTSRKPGDIDPKAYAAMYFAGGHGTMWDFPDAATLSQHAATIYEHGGVVGAVCHGPAGLLNVRLANGTFLVAGKKVAAFTNQEEEAVGLTRVVPFLLADALTARGALHQAAPPWQKNVVVDERLVTGQNPASAAGVAQAMCALLT
jgi:putative intracellular protease/amidase